MITRQQLESELRALAAQILEVEDHTILMNAELIDQGLNSISVVELVMGVEQKYGIAIDVDEMVQFSSLDGLVTLLQARLGHGSRA